MNDTGVGTAADTARMGRGRAAGPVQPVRVTTYSPLPLDSTTITGGLVRRLQDDNAAVSIPRGDEHLSTDGAWANFDNVALGNADAPYHGPVFEDGEAYKWLEAVAWEAARTPSSELTGWLTEYGRKIVDAQDGDGYLSTFVQSHGGRSRRYQHLAWDHEVFNMGALIQAAVAAHRATGDTALLDVAVRAADHLDATFGNGKRETTDGHPVIEMALVELYRVTRESRYLALAGFFVEIRGRRTISDADMRFDTAYFSDRLPVRETLAPEGHAVRAVYFAAGATDVAIETGDAGLLGALETQWYNMVESKMYLTGGLGSRWEGEAFGDSYELPSDRAYAETCAAIASWQWSWRLLLATGKSCYADLMERQLYNAILPGVSLDGDSYFYVNALQVRTGALRNDPLGKTPANGRQHWYGCSCCPTNLMRTFATLHGYLATASDGGVQVHQFAEATIEAPIGGSQVQIAMATAYPWDGTVTVTVEQSPTTGWTLSLRVPAWASDATASVNGDDTPVQSGSYLQVQRNWRVGDVVILRLPMAPRLLVAHARIDGARGAVAIGRGPLVYAVEQADQPAGPRVDDLQMDRLALTEVYRPDLFGGIPTITFDAVPAVQHDRAYTPTGEREPSKPTHHITAIPYFMWANRAVGPMKVWIPISPEALMESSGRSFVPPPPGCGQVSEVEPIEYAGSG